MCVSIGLGLSRARSSRSSEGGPGWRRTPTNSLVPFFPVGGGAYESAAFFAAISASVADCEAGVGVGAVDEGGGVVGGEVLDAQRCCWKTAELLLDPATAEVKSLLLLLATAELTSDRTGERKSREAKDIGKTGFEVKSSHGRQRPSRTAAA